MWYNNARQLARCLPFRQLSYQQPLLRWQAVAIAARACSAGPSTGTKTVTWPALRQLRILFLQSAVPMIGFGLMDNTVMIQVGDLIDSTLGVALALPTLAAAACGQVLSGMSGTIFGGTVEAAATRLGLPVAELSTAQRRLPAARVCATAGATCGVAFGCTIAMLQLLVMDLGKAERQRREENLGTVFQTVLHEGRSLLRAQRSTLYVVDKEQQELWTRVMSSRDKKKPVPFKMGWHDGIAGYCVKTGLVLRIKDAYTLPFFNRTFDEASKFKTGSVLCVPVTSPETGDVLAIAQFINKRAANSESADPEGFSEEDEKLARMLANHVAIFIASVG